MVALGRALIVGASSILIAGCAIHPLPKHVTRDTTLSIIKKIRCEARDAIIYELMDVIVEVGSRPNRDTIRWILRDSVDAQTIENFLEAVAGHPDRKVRHEFVKLLADNVTIRQLNALTSANFDSSNDPEKPGTLQRILRFKDSNIGYSFRFEISEQNKKDGSLTFKVPFITATRTGTFTLGISGGAQKDRENERNIKVGESFSKLVLKYDDCWKRRPRRHYIYPITGRIGLDEMVFTFIESVKLNVGVSSLSDKLKFTTKFSGGVNPSVTMSPITEKFKLTDASLDVSAFRQDIHEVTIAIEVPKPKTVGKKIKLATGVDLVVQVPKAPAPPRVMGTRPSYMPPSRRETRGMIGEGVLSITKQKNRYLEEMAIDELKRIESLSINRNILEKVR